MSGKHQGLIDTLRKAARDWWNIPVRDSGLTPAELEFLRKDVRWQAADALDAVDNPPKAPSQPPYWFPGKPGPLA